MGVLASVTAVLTASSVLTAIPAAPEVRSWITTADGVHRLEQVPAVAVHPGARSAGSPTAVVIDPRTRYQTMRGFGASFTDSSANLVNASPQRDAVMHKLFDPYTGIGLSSLRQPMGSTDFSTGFTTYDDVPAGQTDWDLKHFSVDRDKRNILPLLRQARSLNPGLGIMATPWSPPAWMKDSRKLTKGSLNPAAYKTYAQYFVRFLRDYAVNGVKVNAVTPQNEPETTGWSYPSATMSAAAQGAFIGNDLGPALDRAGLGDTQILAYDHNWDDVGYPRQVLADPKAAKYIDGVAFHCYGGKPAAQSGFHAAHPNVPVHITECSGTESGDTPEGELGDGLLWQVGALIIDGTRNWASSVHLWNIALNPEHGPTRGWCENCTGLVTVNPDGKVVYNAGYYALGHASKFVKPGARRIASHTDGDQNITSTAFRNPDGTIVVIALNRGTSDKSFDLSRPDQHATVSLPARSVGTFVAN